VRVSARRRAISQSATERVKLSCWRGARVDVEASKFVEFAVVRRSSFAVRRSSFVVRCSLTVTYYYCLASTWGVGAMCRC